MDTVDDLKLGVFRGVVAVAVKRRMVIEQGAQPPVKPLSDSLSHFSGQHWSVWSLWTREEFGEPRQGMYIGKRTIYDGRLEYEGDEVGNVFIARRHHTAYLFVFDERTNPVYVFPEDVFEERSQPIYLVPE